ncbi:MAG TPA: hypothetical protein VGK33_03275, partial [Chloroflexota bacterium]
LEEGWLLLADRLFYGWDGWCAAADSGADTTNTWNGSPQRELTQNPLSGKLGADQSPDATPALISRNRTQCDAVRRNSAAWHAEGQGFESP